MKKQSLSIIAKKFFLGNLLVAAIFLSAQNKSLAQNRYQTIPLSVSAENKASVKYTGSNENSLLFSLQYENSNGKPFVVSITNEYGETVYRNVSKEKLFSKVFELPKEAEYKKLSFSIKADQVNFLESFSINVEIKTTENFVVSKN